MVAQLSKYLHERCLNVLVQYHWFCAVTCIGNGDRAFGLQGLQTSLSGLPLKASCKWSITDIAVRRMTSNEAAPMCGLRGISSAQCRRPRRTHVERTLSWVTSLG